jgi:hypothetical protein
MDIHAKCFVHAFIVSYINLIIFFADVYGSSSSKSKHCISRNSEITCNYVPLDIPDSTKSVNLRIISENTLSKGLFSTYNWGQITNLEISVGEDWHAENETAPTFELCCFCGLNSLEVLRIGISQKFKLANDSFVGLENLKCLDLSGCRRLNLEDVLDAIDNYNVLPNLHSLILAFLNSYRTGLSFDERFFKIISDKKVKVLDISSTQIRYINMTSFLNHCHYLEFINISRVRKDSFKTYINTMQSCQNLKTFDASYTMLPSNIVLFRGKSEIIYKNENIPININWLNSANFPKNIRDLNMSGVLPK